MDPLWFYNGSLVVYPMVPYRVVPYGLLFLNDSLVVPPIDSRVVPLMVPYGSLNELITRFGSRLVP